MAIDGPSSAATTTLPVAASRQARSPKRRTKAAGFSSLIRDGPTTLDEEKSSDRKTTRSLSPVRLMDGNGFPTLFKEGAAGGRRMLTTTGNLLLFNRVGGCLEEEAPEQVEDNDGLDALLDQFRNSGNAATTVSSGSTSSGLAHDGEESSVTSTPQEMEVQLPQSAGERRRAEQARSPEQEVAMTSSSGDLLSGASNRPRRTTTTTRRRQQHRPNSSSRSPARNMADKNDHQDDNKRRDSRRSRRSEAKPSASKHNKSSRVGRREEQRHRRRKERRSDQEQDDKVTERDESSASTKAGEQVQDEKVAERDESSASKGGRRRAAIVLDEDKQEQVSASMPDLLPALQRQRSSRACGTRSLSPRRQQPSQRQRRRRIVAATDQE